MIIKTHNKLILKLWEAQSNQDNPIRETKEDSPLKEQILLGTEVKPPMS